MNYSKINSMPWETDQDYWRCRICGSLNAELEENLDQAHKDNVTCHKSEGTTCGACLTDAKNEQASLGRLEQAARDSTNMNMLEAGLIQPEDL